jgi:hypothetical protein
MSREIMAGIRMGEILYVSMVASSASYSPDVSDDLARRASWMFGEALHHMDDIDLIDHIPSEDSLDDEEDDDELATPERELQIPHVVKFMTEGFDGRTDA